MKNLIYNCIQKKPVDGSEVLVFLLLCLLMFPLRLQSQDHFVSNGKKVDIGRFNSEVLKMMEEIGVPGVSLAVIENGKVVFSEGYGIRQSGSGGKVDKRTIFEACSLSKSFLVAVAFQLAEEGKLDLDKPMWQYLEYAPLQHDARYKMITPRMILSHSSGIENWRSNNNPDTLEILTPPGQKFVYSGEGYRYLAQVIELLLNQSYRKYINDRVIKPLDLKRSFTSYRLRGKYPGNYAIGHRAMGDLVDKWKNWNTNPAAGNHTTAGDYARLVLSIFENSNMSAKGRATLLQPMVVVSTATPSLFYAPGFEVLYSGNDTIIAHGGDNDGFKANMFYSVVNKRGFVIMTNSDLGKLMSAQICKMSAGLNIDTYFNRFPFDQYPSASIQLLNIFKRNGRNSMFDQIDVLKNDGRLKENTLAALGDVFINADMEIAARLASQNLEMYPDVALTHVYQGYIQMRAGQFEEALKNLTEAQRLNFNMWEIDQDLANCRQRLADSQFRVLYVSDIGDSATSVIEAERYNTMYGIEVLATTDITGGDNVGYIDTGDWMEYHINVAVPGTYKIAFRISSLHGKNRIELNSGSSFLASLDVPSTNSWERWATISTQVNLLPGQQTLKLCAGIGGFAVNWIEFVPPTAIR
jgi:CubicO group peptidase (beta-lactamase class C family)